MSWFDDERDDHGASSGRQESMPTRGGRDPYQTEGHSGSLGGLSDDEMEPTRDGGWRNRRFPPDSGDPRGDDAGDYHGEQDHRWRRESSERRQGRYGPLSYTSYAEYWVIPGRYTGVGPKGYRRSPERLREQICERLTDHGGIDASNIEVEVEGAEATLTGRVPSREQKRMAEDCADSVRGISDVHNRLSVNHQMEDEDRWRSDATQDPMLSNPAAGARKTPRRSTEPASPGGSRGGSPGENRGTGD
jgi:hypothetical protein